MYSATYDEENNDHYQPPLELPSPNLFQQCQDRDGVVSFQAVIENLQLILGMTKSVTKSGGGGKEVDEGDAGGGETCYGICPDIEEDLQNNHEGETPTATTATTEPHTGNVPKKFTENELHPDVVKELKEIWGYYGFPIKTQEHFDRFLEDIAPKQQKWKLYLSKTLHLLDVWEGQNPSLNTDNVINNLFLYLSNRRENPPLEWGKYKEALGSALWSSKENEVEKTSFDLFVKLWFVRLPLPEEGKGEAFLEEIREFYQPGNGYVGVMGQVDAERTIKGDPDSLIVRYSSNSKGFVISYLAPDHSFKHVVIKDESITTLAPHKYLQTFAEKVRRRVGSRRDK